MYSIVFVKCKYERSNRFTLPAFYVRISFGLAWPEFVKQDQSTWTRECWVTWFGKRNLAILIRL